MLGFKGDVMVERIAQTHFQRHFIILITLAQNSSLQIATFNMWQYHLMNSRRIIYLFTVPNTVQSNTMHLVTLDIYFQILCTK